VAVGAVGDGVGGGVVAAGRGGGAVGGAGWNVGLGAGPVVGCGVGEVSDGAEVAGGDGLEDGTWSPAVGSSTCLGVGDRLGSSTGVGVLWLSDAAGSSGWPTSFVGGEATSAAEGGSTTWLSTTDTPAQATPTAAALAASHIENSISFFMSSVSPFAADVRVKATLNEP